MAQPIPLNPPPRDVREELQTQLDQAPIEHAEALLDAYELLQQLHNRRILAGLRGALGAGGTIVEKLADAASTLDSIIATRNALVLAKMLASIDPDVLQGVAVAVAETMKNTPNQRTPGLFALMAQFRSEEARRSVAMLNGFLVSLGAQLELRRNPSSASKAS
jgi:uncharacterized protein YjgD (DUF1641 family)